MPTLSRRRFLAAGAIAAAGPPWWSMRRASGDAHMTNHEALDMMQMVDVYRDA